MTKRAFTISRFQPFHLGHYDTIQRMRNDGYDEIVIGIGSAEKSNHPRYPFSCGERIEMINSVLRAEGVDNYFFVPVRDLNDYDLWVAHIVRLSPEFEVVYAGNPLTSYLFGRAGYKVVKERRKTVSDWKKSPPESVQVSGSTIREMIVDHNDAWKKLVPRQVCEKILEFDGEERIRELYSMLGHDE